MPAKGGKLTAQEAQFIGHYAATGDATYSAKMARYSHPSIQGWQKAQNPAIAEATRKVQVNRLNNDLLPKSLDLLEKVILDDKEATRNRITAAQTVLKYSLGQSEGADSKEPHEMTPQELQSRIDALRKAMSDKAVQIVEGETIDQGPDGSVFD